MSPPAPHSPVETERFGPKAAQLRKGAAAGRLGVITDFDRTVTKCYLSGGGRSASAHGVLEGYSRLSDEYHEFVAGLLQKYLPIEYDVTIPLEEKLPLMKHWYEQGHVALAKEDLSRGDIDKAVAEAQERLELREWAVEVFEECAARDIPMIVVSAGLGNIIWSILRRVLSPAALDNITLISNWLYFEGEGEGDEQKLSGHSPVLHMFNKTMRGRDEALKRLDGRSEILLIGDTMGDLTMVDGVEAENVLKVGYLADYTPVGLEKYSEEGAFDVVLLGDGGMELPLELIKCAPQLNK